MTRERERVWMAFGGVAAVTAAILAFLDAAWSRAALAGELALLVIGAYLLLSRKIERVRGSVVPLNAQGRENAKEIGRATKEIAKVGRSIAKLQVAQEKKIALAVQRIEETLSAKMHHEAAGIKAVVKDTEIESGLAALNRYTAMASEPSSDPTGSESGK